MKQLLTLAMVSFLFVSCSKKDEKIDFSSEYAKVDFCVLNLDNTNCRFYRPMFVASFTVFENKGLSYLLVDDVTSSEAMTKYKYTSQYKKDIENINKINSSNPDDIRIKTFWKYLKNSFKAS